MSPEAKVMPIQEGIVGDGTLSTTIWTLPTETIGHTCAGSWPCRSAIHIAPLTMIILNDFKIMQEPHNIIFIHLHFEKEVNCWLHHKHLLEGRHCIIVVVQQSSKSFFVLIICSSLSSSRTFSLGLCFGDYSSRFGKEEEEETQARRKKASGVCVLLPIIFLGCNLYTFY